MIQATVNGHKEITVTDSWYGLIIETSTNNGDKIRAKYNWATRSERGNPKLIDCVGSTARMVESNPNYKETVKFFTQLVKKGLHTGVLVINGQDSPDMYSSCIEVRKQGCMLSFCKINIIDRYRVPEYLGSYGITNLTTGEIDWEGASEDVQSILSFVMPLDAINNLLWEMYFYGVEAYKESFILCEQFKRETGIILNIRTQYAENKKVEVIKRLIAAYNEADRFMHLGQLPSIREIIVVPKLKQLHGTFSANYKRISITKEVLARDEEMPGKLASTFVHEFTHWMETFLDDARNRYYDNNRMYLKGMMEALTDSGGRKHRMHTIDSIYRMQENFYATYKRGLTSSFIQYIAEPSELLANAYQTAYLYALGWTYEELLEDTTNFYMTQEDIDIVMQYLGSMKFDWE